MGKRKLISLKIPYKWELIILLSFSFFFNQADRQIFNVLLPDIRESFNLTYSDMGLISSILTLVYGLLVPVAGLMGDYFNKKYIIMLSLFVWSSATLLTGISFTFLQLILLRSVATGGGEAFYAPPANALISEYHKKTLASAMSVHQAASYMGIVLGGSLAGYIAYSHGWRTAFHLFGGLGILLAAIIYFRMKTPVKNDATLVSDMGMKRALVVFKKKPTAILLTIAFSGMIFVNVSFLTWMPTFLYEQFNFSLARAGFVSTFFHFIAAFIGVIIGAKISDKKAKKLTGMRGLIQAIGLLLGAPFIYIMGTTNSVTIIYVALTLFGFFRGIYDSNIFAALYDVIEIPFRSTATGVMLMFAFIIGSASPYILGVLKPVLGLSSGFALLSLVYVVSALCILLAVLKFYKRDQIIEGLSGGASPLSS